MVANIVGFSGGMDDSVARDVGFWIFAAFLPLALIANYLAWKLTK